ncbi:MAG: hydrogenase maturation protease [Verrucomicrobiae bacterium]|nr:hydrogenase maturation protease [Verrucomicrobiae bacterium]
MNSWLLVIGYGNTLRGDDAAGPIAAGAVASLGLPGTRVETRHQLVPELSADIATAGIVIFMDAGTLTDRDPPRVTQLRSLRVTGRPMRQPLFGHHLDPSAVLAVAARVYGRRPAAWLLTITAEAFEAGSAPSPRCTQGIAEATRIVVSIARCRRLAMRFLPDAGVS